MTKILIPILILAGLVLGLVYLLARRKVAVDGSASASRAVVMMAAASVAGILGASGCKDKKMVEEPRTLCYKTTMVQDVGTASDEVRSDVLDKLHGDGKISDAVYREALAQIEKKSLFKDKALSDEEKDAIAGLREMNAELVASLGKEKRWTALGVMVGKLMEKLAQEGATPSGGGAFDAEKAAKLLDDLSAQGHFDEGTGKALATVLDEVSYHHDRSSGGKTCYKMKKIGSQMAGWRGDLTRMMQDIEKQEPSDEAYTEHLGTLATAMSCFETQTEEACEAGPDEGDARVSMVRTLDLLIALVRK